MGKINVNELTTKKLDSINDFIEKSWGIDDCVIEAPSIQRKAKRLLNTIEFENKAYKLNGYYSDMLYMIAYPDKVL